MCLFIGRKKKKLSEYAIMLNAELSVHFSVASLTSIGFLFMYLL